MVSHERAFEFINVTFDGNVALIPLDEGGMADKPSLRTQFPAFHELCETL